jgi:phenylpyruvate tautomerase PptA (4-oxalocrotonate tautomerase family)
MPFAHVRSLPVPPPFDAAVAVRTISAELAHAAAVAERHVTVTWQTLAPGHYASGGETAAEQPRASHPVLIDVLAPDFYTEERIEAMLSAVAAAVSRAAGVAADNVFVDFRPARSGHVLDGGDAVRW